MVIDLLINSYLYLKVLLVDKSNQWIEHFSTWSIQITWYGSSLLSETIKSIENTHHNKAKEANFGLKVQIPAWDSPMSNFVMEEKMHVQSWSLFKIWRMPTLNFCEWMFVINDFWHADKCCLILSCNPGYILTKLLQILQPRNCLAKMPTFNIFGNEIALKSHWIRLDCVEVLRFWPMICVWNSLYKLRRCLREILFNLHSH